MLRLSRAVSAEFTIKQSRFVVHASAVESQAETLDFYTSVADLTASHNCWAWKLEQSHRCNDDGEPAGTAGKPILAAIEGRDLNQVMVVVTRYFGGIKLGVGGLIRAYGGSAAKCLDGATLVKHHPVAMCLVEASFEWTGAVHAAIEALEARKITEDFDANGQRIGIEVRLDRLRRLQSMIRDSTRGEANCKRI